MTRITRGWSAHLGLFAALWLAACATTSPSSGPCPDLSPTYPGLAWETIANPECAGWSNEGLEEVRAHLSGMATTGMIASVGGRVLFQYGNTDTLTYLASVRKSVLSMLYGIQVDRGVIDIDDTLAELGIDDVGGLTDQEKQATTRHLLMARSGIYHEASNSGDDLASAPPRGSQAPGTYYLYSNWDFNALGTIFEQETGRSIYDALGEDLARPLGFQDWNREMHRRTGNARRSMHLAYHMYLSVRDMARIGLVMLRNGEWNGRQIVPADWVRESTRALTRVHEMNPDRRKEGPFGYGYLWWVFDGDVDDLFEGAYTGLGAVGQHIFVMPKLDLVVAHKTAPGQDRGSVSHNEFLAMIEVLLDARCSNAQVPGQPRRVQVGNAARIGATRGGMMAPMPRYPNCVR